MTDQEKWAIEAKEIAAGVVCMNQYGRETLAMHIENAIAKVAYEKQAEIERLQKAVVELAKACPSVPPIQTLASGKSLTIDEVCGVPPGSFKQYCKDHPNPEAESIYYHKEHPKFEAAVMAATMIAAEHFDALKIALAEIERMRGEMRKLSFPPKRNPAATNTTDPANDERERPQ